MEGIKKGVWGSLWRQSRHKEPQKLLVLRENALCDQIAIRVRSVEQ